MNENILLTEGAGLAAVWSLVGEKLRVETTEVLPPLFHTVPSQQP